MIISLRCPLRPMSTARRAPKRPAVSDSSDDEHDIIDLCSVGSGDEAVRVAGGSAAAVRDALVDSESEESDSDTETEGRRAISYASLLLSFFSLQACLFRCSCARV